MHVLEIGRGQRDLAEPLGLRPHQPNHQTRWTIGQHSLDPHGLAEQRAGEDLAWANGRGASHRVGSFIKHMSAMMDGTSRRIKTLGDRRGANRTKATACHSIPRHRTAAFKIARTCDIADFTSPRRTSNPRHDFATSGTPQASQSSPNRAISGAE